MKPTLFIIEDNEPTVFGYTQFLSKTGYDVDVAATLKTADALLASGRPDAILLDMKLPDGSGIDWLEKTRKRNPDMRSAFRGRHSIEK
jgi:DNA-binding response OmpR family regulator